MSPKERDDLIEAMKATFSTREEMNARFEQVPTREEMKQHGEEMLRRYLVVAEETRSVVQGLAEGIQSLGERIDARFAERDARRTEELDPLRGGYRYLDQRVGRLEREVFGDPEPPAEPRRGV